MESKRIISVGAESAIYLYKGTIVKERVKKLYRIKEIDESIRKRRTRLEFSLMKRAFESGIRVPAPIKISEDNYSIYMGYLGNERFKDNFSVDRMSELGEEVAKMHKIGIVHGDLTTANLMLKDDKLYLIDFGLGMYSNKDEDKATDIFLLKNALSTRHPKESEIAFKSFLKSYRHAYGKQFKGIETHLKDIESRRRYNESY